MVDLLEEVEPAQGSDVRLGPILHIHVVLTLTPKP